MKITEMLSREDFYSINQETLDRFYKSDGNRTTLYIYPRLNAIVTAKPGREVIRYLLTEYAVRSAVKRFFTKKYVKLCLLSRGALASGKLDVNHLIHRNTLIYPCNKKYRIFDFDNGIVSVIVKSRFGNEDFLHETELRTKNDRPDFIPPIIACSSLGYSEPIIDGVPLARISKAEKFASFQKKSYDLLRASYQKYDRMVETEAYTANLSDRIMTSAGKRGIDWEKLQAVIRSLTDACKSLKTIPIGFSHGDLQPGNIWIENRTNKIYVIDWESWGERSLWYDKEVLFCGLRPGNIQNYLFKRKNDPEKHIVLLEDVMFQLNELNNLPDEFGCRPFNEYVETVHEWISKENQDA